MKQVIFNIGLNNNTMGADNVVSTLFINKFALSKWAIKDGIYEDTVEPTVVAYGHTDLSTEQIISITQRMCVFMTQECIAVKIDGVGYLVYSPDFEGERYEFNEQYFLK
jgi:hypothetical protein